MMSAQRCLRPRSRRADALARREERRFRPAGARASGPPLRAHAASAPKERAHPRAPSAGGGDSASEGRVEISPHRWAWRSLPGARRDAITQVHRHGMMRSSMPFRCLEPSPPNTAPGGALSGAGAVRPSRTPSPSTAYLRSVHHPDGLHTRSCPSRTPRSHRRAAGARSSVLPERPGVFFVRLQP